MMTSLTLNRRHLMLATALACGATSTQSADAPLRVVATFSILADMVREVGGDAVAVHALVGPDADAHDYEPTPADVKRLAGADLVLMNGLGFEGWIQRLVTSSATRAPVVTATQGITPRQGGEHGHDPHAWQSLANAVTCVNRIRDALIAARPAQRPMFERRASAYQATLAAVDADARARFAALTPAQRRVVTSHDAFGYFAARYGLTMLAPQGWNTESEPSAADVARIVRQLRQQKASALFVENISNARLIERIAKESGAVVGGTLYSDALSAPGTAADTYAKMMAHNVNTLLAALQPQNAAR
jgi:zinc/manganese transport system substrate-binding protein